jgi:hypothetical protein
MNALIYLDGVTFDYLFKLLKEETRQRRGQYLFNRLDQDYPAIAEKIADTEYDPFYDDTRVVAFERRVRELWNE